MAELTPLLSSLHLLGAALGCAGITFAEIFYLKATSDGRIDTREQSYIRSTYWAMKWGLSLALISGLLLTIAQYQSGSPYQIVMYSALWMQDTLALLIIFSGWALAAKRTSWWFATSVAFSAWWMMLLLHGWLTIPLSYMSLVFLYVVFAGATAIILGYFRSVFHPDNAKTV
jgi:hypothetical protein